MLFKKVPAIITIFPPLLRTSFRAFPLRFPHPPDSGKKNQAALHIHSRRARLCLLLLPSFFSFALSSSSSTRTLTTSSHRQAATVALSSHRFTSSWSPTRSILPRGNPLSWPDLGLNSRFAFERSPCFYRRLLCRCACSLLLLGRGMGRSGSREPAG